MAEPSIPAVIPSHLRTYSPDEIRLCTRIIYDHFGLVVARVATILLNRGRLTFREIHSFVISSSQNSAASGRVGATSAPSSSLSASAQPNPSASSSSNNPNGISLGGSMGQGQIGATWTSNISAVHTVPLTKSLIQHALLVLVQHNLLYHVRLESDGTFHNPTKKEGEDPTQLSIGGTEYFELNPSEIFPRVRFGWYLEISRNDWGRKGRDLMSQILKLGKVKAGDLLDSFQELDWEKRMKENGFQVEGDQEGEKEEEVEEEEEEEPTKISKGRKTKAKGKGKEKEKQTKSSKRKRSEQVERREDPCLPRLLAYLLLNSYLRLSLPSSHTSPKEKSIAYEVEEKKKLSGVLTPKEIKEMQARVQARISREEGIESGKWSSRTGVKIVSSSSSTIGSKSKKSKLSSSNSNSLFNDFNSNERNHLLPNDSKIDYMNEMILENGNGHYEIDRETWLRVNYHAFDLNIRDEKIVELVQGCYNEQTGKVFKEVLKFAREKEDEMRKKDGDEEGEADIMTAGGREKSVGIKVKSLADRFPSATSIARAFDRDSLLPKSKSKSKSSKSSKSSSSEGPTRVEVLSELFDLLSHSSFSHSSSSSFNQETSTLPLSTYSSPNLPLHGLQLLSGFGTSHLPLTLGNHGPSARTMASWTIEYAKAGSEIKLQLLHVCVEEQFGKEAARIVGFIAKKGRVDEKMLMKYTLLTASTVRSLSSLLFQSSILSLQEVPKTTDRSAARTFFLWYLNMRGYQSWLLDHICRAQTRVAERRAVEREKKRTVLSKIERSDVQALVKEAEEEIENSRRNGNGYDDDGYDSEEDQESVEEKVEEEVLTTNERSELKEYKQLMRILTVAEMRLDRDYWCVKNLPG